MYSSIRTRTHTLESNGYSRPYREPVVSVQMRNGIPLWNLNVFFVMFSSCWESFPNCATTCSHPLHKCLAKLPLVSRNRSGTGGWASALDSLSRLPTSLPASSSSFFPSFLVIYPPFHSNSTRPSSQTGWWPWCTHTHRHTHIYIWEARMLSYQHQCHLVQEDRKRHTHFTGELSLCQVKE